MKGLVWERKQINEIIGDDLYDMFASWAKRQWPYGNTPEQVVRAFALWCVSTPEGADAMGRLQECPRQLTLAFPDDVRPWKEIRIEEEGKVSRIVYVNGTSLMLKVPKDMKCPACGR